MGRPASGPRPRRSRLRPAPLQEAPQELPRGAVRLSAHPLFTIGYEGKTVAEFHDELEAAGVTLLIDVRAVAASRRPGFSKTALGNGLRERGIGYLHLRPLGTPAKGREAARAGRVAEMREIYAEQLETPEALVALEQALEAAQEKRAALLCYEKEAPCCHRAMLAERMIARVPFEVIDL